MFRPVLVITTVLIVIATVVSGLFDRNVLIHYGPNIGGQFHYGDRCDRNIESLLIALQGYRYVYTGADFGLKESVFSLDQHRIGSDRYRCSRVSKKSLNPDLVRKINGVFEGYRSQAKSGLPPKILFDIRSKNTYYNNSKYYYFSGIFGRMNAAYTAYNTVYSGKGLTNLLRCDISLRLEPYHSFILSDMHHGFVGNDIKDRIAECGLEQLFQAEIDAILNREIGTMNVLVQD